MSVDVYVTLAGHSRIDFDSKKIRKALRREAAPIRKIAKKLVSRRAVSQPGDYPGKLSGALQRSIKTKISKSGFTARVSPTKTAEMGADFYPAILGAGSRGKGKVGKAAAGEGVGASNRRRRGQRAKLVADRNNNNGFVIAPRANYMEESLNQRRSAATNAITLALKDSLIPR